MILKNFELKELFHLCAKTQLNSNEPNYMRWGWQEEYIYLQKKTSVNDRITLPIDENYIGNFRDNRSTTDMPQRI